MTELFTELLGECFMYRILKMRKKCLQSVFQYDNISSGIE